MAKTAKRTQPALAQTVASATTTAPAKTGPPVRVQATAFGFYDNIRRRVGDVFMCERQAFSTNWMELVAENVPERITTGTADLRRLHDDILREKAGTFPGVTDDNPLGG